MKKLILSILLLFLTLFLNSEIILTPIVKTVLYDNFSGDLNPFTFSSKNISIDKNTELKLLDEIDYSNGVLGDILKVEILNGNNRGQVGYVPEEYLALSDITKKKGVSFFLKEDSSFGNIKIKKENRLILVSSKVEESKEVLTIAPLDGNLKNENITILDKNLLRFIIDKKSEISYYLRKGWTVIKCVDATTFLPVEKVRYGEYSSDRDGFLYIENAKEKIILTKDGYAPSYIERQNNKLVLSFLKKTEAIKKSDKTDIILQNDFCKIESNSDKTDIYFLDTNSADIFSFPKYNSVKSVIRSGFFIKQAGRAVITIDAGENKTELLKFDEESFKWTIVALSNKENKLYAIVNKEGFYIIANEAKENNSKQIKIIKKDSPISQFFIRNGDASFYNQTDINRNDLSVTAANDVCELNYFSPDAPFEVMQKKITGNLIELNNPDAQKERKGFHPLFNGVWLKRIIKVDNKIINDKKNILEELGNLTISNEKLITFENNNLRISGELEVIDKKKLYIHINSINKICKETIAGQLFFINPSLFNAQALIPAFYSFKAGILELDFDNIFITRKNIIKKSSDENIVIDSYTMQYPKFPESESKAKYKIFFTQ